MNKSYVLGIDIGGTNTAIGVVDARGNVVGATNLRTQSKTSFDEYIEEIFVETSKLLASLGISLDEIQGIGVGAPNANYYNGTIENAANLRWKGILPLVDELYKKFGVPAACTNDANAAAIGEMTYGAAKGMKNFIMITLGTGVGSGIVANGQLLYGSDGFAGELGHVTVKRNNGRLCGCGRTGCLECYCSATGVARSAREILEFDSKPSLLRNIPLEDITSKDVYDAAISGDEVAKQIFNYTGRILGEAFTNFVAFSAPEAIILFGGLAKAGDLLSRPIKEAMAKNILFVWKDKVPVLLSELKDTDAAVLGASALGWEADRKF